MKNILVICGPTASGKTSLAISVAKELVGAIHESPVSVIPVKTGIHPINPNSPVNILSVDSRQIYQGLDLVTGKDIPADLPPNIHFYGLDLTPPDKPMNLAEFVQYATPVIAKSIQNNTPLIIVGGTGLYLKALTQKLSNLSVPPNPILREDLEKLTVEDLQNLLFDTNPKKALSLNNSDIHNPRRLIRAIEIASSLRGRLGDQSNLVHPCHSRAGGNPSNYSDLTNINFHWLGLHPDPETQKKNIRQRVLDRLEAGAIEEVKKILEKYPNQKLPVFTSLGVAEIIQFLDSKVTREQLVDLWTNAEVDYARRQMVWFKKQPDIIWYDKGSPNLVSELAKILQNNDYKKAR